MPKLLGKGHNKFDYKRFKGTLRPHKIIHVPLENMKIIRCLTCNDLFVKSVEEGKRVNCTHCRSSMRLSNPYYYRKIKGMTIAEINKINNSQTLLKRLLHNL